MDSVSAVPSASKIQMDYMKLLVTQLQNQNPLEPLDNNEMASQLAQFSQLSQLESMNSSFAGVLTTLQRTYANSLIGKDVEFAVETDTGEESTMSGTVEQVDCDSDGKISLTVGSYTLGLEDITSVKLKSE
jgi:flagellar basal-body rod modification protein FlgD